MRVTPVGTRPAPASLREIRQKGIAYCPISDAPSLIAPLTLVSRRGESRTIVIDFIELCVSHEALKPRRTKSARALATRSKPKRR